MAAKRNRTRRRRRLKPGIHGIGLSGLGCIIWAVVGLMQSAQTPEPAQSKLRTPAEASSSLARAERSYYPLEVGRYWVYKRQDLRSGVVIEDERRIVRRESRPDQDLFFFSDGTVAYTQGGKVFEVGPNGGVNVIPVDTAFSDAPFIYRSQGFHIEKSIGAVDTALVRGERRYEGCIEVITQFRPLDQGVANTMSYVSYFARGVGLVGREEWPRQTAGTLSTVLVDSGVNHL